MKKRVLHVLNGLGNGGAESFIMNTYRKIDREEIQFDFLLRSNDNNPDVLREAKQLGANITILPSFPKNIIKNYIETCKFFKQNKYNIIHVHANALIYIIPFIVAKRNGVSHRILHSHNTMTQKGKIPKIIHYWHRIYLKTFATDYFACGYEAGKWMFGNNRFILLNNAIDTKKYVFNYGKRHEMRKKMNLENKLVFGHVGRFNKQKNHEFLIDVFNKISSNEANAILILVGTGELIDEIKTKVINLGLQSKVIFLGQREDVCDLLQIMDTLIFPSLYEGLPFALIEAQAAGLPILSSDSVSPKAKITSLLEYYSLKNTCKDWADKAVQMSREVVRLNTEHLIKEAHYDIDENVNILFKLYHDM